MAVPTKDSVIPSDASDDLHLDKHIDFIAKYGKVNQYHPLIHSFWNGLISAQK